MKTKKHFIAILMLVLTAFAAHADAKTDALVKAAAQNNVAEARRFIREKADVNAADYQLAFLEKRRRDLGDILDWAAREKERW